MLRRTFPIPLFLMLMTAPVLGKEKAPLQEEDYLGSAVGARPISLGGALTGVGGDESSLYWNPAGLNLLPVKLISISFGSEPVRGISQLFNPSLRRRGLSSLSVSGPETALGWHALARVAFEDSVSLEVDQGETTEVWKDIEFWADEYLFSITTMAQREKLPSDEDFFVGINVKYIRAELGLAERQRKGGSWQEPEANLDTGNGYGIDVGALLHLEKLSLGLSVQNLMAKVYWKDYEPERIGANLMGGFSILPSNWLTLAGALERRWKRGASTILHLGGEATFRRESLPGWFGIFTSFSPSVRLGMYGPDLSKREGRVFTGGLGYVYSHYKVDTAVYGADIDNLGYVVTFSIPF